MRLVMLRVVRLTVGVLAAVATAAATPAPPPPWTAFVLFGGDLFGQVGCGVGFRRRLGCLVTFGGAEILEIVFLFERRRQRLRPLGDRFGCFGRVHLLAAVDYEGLRRPHRFIRRDRDGDDEALL